MSTKPLLKALVLADHVYQDAQTKKWIIAGTFNQVKGRKLPITMPPCHFYLSLTDFRGPCEIQLELRLDDTNEVLVQTAPFKFHMENPLQTVEICLPVPSLTFSRTGAYSFNVLWESEILGSQRIAVGLTDKDGAKE